MMNKDKFKKVESLLSEARKNLNEAISEPEEAELEEFESREAYLEEFDRVCGRFGVEVELEEDNSKDEVYSEWNDHVNMTATELKKWSKNPCSREASVDPQAVIKRNLRLLERNKEDWTSNDVEDAERTISFINRMKANRPDSPREGPHGCPSEWAVSMLNWAFNPFDSVPTPSGEVKDDLDPVEEVNLSSELQERRNIKEAEMLAEQVWMLKDVMVEFEDEFGRIARDLETEKDMDEVERLRSQTVDAISLMMTKLESPMETVQEEMQDSGDGYEFGPVPDQVLYESQEDAEERAESLGIEGFHVHPLIFREPENIPDDLMEDVTVYNMPGETHEDWVKAVEGSEEMSDSREASQVVHGDQEKHLEADDGDEDVRVPPVAIHKVEGGGQVEVSDDVEQVLDELWEENSE